MKSKRIIIILIIILSVINALLAMLLFNRDISYEKITSDIEEYKQDYNYNGNNKLSFEIIESKKNIEDECLETIVKVTNNTEVEITSVCLRVEGYNDYHRIVDQDFAYGTDIDNNYNSDLAIRPGKSDLLRFNFSLSMNSDLKIINYSYKLLY